MAKRDRVARGTELGGTAVAGTVGAMLGAAKLRDAYKEDYGSKHFEQAAAHTGRVVPKAGRLARIASEGRPGFIPLATGTVAAASATGARRYRQHREKQAHHAGTIAKADPKKVPTKGYVKGIGQVRILHYHGSGHFMVLDRRDEKRLVHRNQIRFSKSLGTGVSAFGIGHTVSKKSDHIIQVADTFSDKVTSLKRKAVPSVPQLVARTADKTRAIVSAEQTKLDKAFDPKRSARRRQRLTETGLAGGATAAAIGSVQATNEGRGHLKTASTTAQARDRAYGAATSHSAKTRDDLATFADSMKRRHGKGVTAEALRDVGTTHNAAHRNLQAGRAFHYQALNSAHRATGTFRRARNLRAGAFGLGAAAVLAHEHNRKSNR